MKSKFEKILEIVFKNRKIISIFTVIISIIIIVIFIGYWRYQKKLEMEKNTDVANAINAIIIQDNCIFNKKPKNSIFSKIDTLSKGTNAYILEKITDEKNNNWYKVKCNERIGYIEEKNIGYYKTSNDEIVLMSDVSKFNIQFEHFKDVKDYQLFLIDNNINYVYIRAGGRGYGQKGNFYEDSQYQIFIDACEYLRIPYGFYYIDEALNSQEIDEEVEFITEFIKNNTTYMNKLPLAIDIESHDGAGRADEIWEDRAFLAEELVQKFNNKGIPNIIYSNAKTANDYLWEVNAKFWIAYYPEITEVPKYWYTDTEQEPVENTEFMNKVIAWQFTESGAGKEISEEVDISLVKNEFFRQFLK